MRLIAGPVLILLASACFSTAEASNSLVVSLSGTWGGNVASSLYTAPNAAWQWSFSMDSQPDVTNCFTCGASLGWSFDAAFAGLNYSLNGQAEPIDTFYGVQFIEPSNPGNLGASFWVGWSDGVFGTPDYYSLSFDLTTTKLYSGQETSPTILPGSYPIDPDGLLTQAEIGPNPITALYPLSGTLLITSTASPEPTTGLLVLAVLVLAARIRHSKFERLRGLR